MTDLKTVIFIIKIKFIYEEFNFTLLTKFYFET